MSKGKASKEKVRDFDFLIEAYAEKLVREGIYSNIEKAMSALRRGHSRRKTCPRTRKPFHKEQKTIFRYPGGHGCLEIISCSECHELLKD